MSDIKPFQVEISDEELDNLKTKLKNTRFPEAETPDDWSQGVPLAYIRELAEYWEKDYDLRRIESRLNTYPQFRTELDGLNIHFLHVRSPEENALPLVMTQGWPGSVIEFLKVIEPRDEVYRAPQPLNQAAA